MRDTTTTQDARDIAADRGRLVGHLIAGLIAGAVGWFTGLFVLLSATGLDHPSWAPVAMLAGASLAGAAVVTLLARLSVIGVVGITSAATLVGVLLGLGMRSMGDSYEWVVLSAIGIVAAVVLVARRLEA